jgi:hypothetical protein
MLDLSRLRVRAFGIDPVETTFRHRGFRCDKPAAQQRLERVGLAFVQGYHLALERPDAAALTPHLEAVDGAMRGFAYEGAAMALALLDGLMPWSASRFTALLAGAGDRHAYMMHVGAGWAAARLPWGVRRIERGLERIDPLLGWLALDGLGFHQGYFDPERYLRRRVEPPHLSAAGRRVFDQGLGRGLWFVEGAAIPGVHEIVLGFPAGRRADLWSGIGLACAYAGGADRSELESLRDLAGDHLPALAQGAAFAAKARLRADNPVPHTELACAVLCDMTAEAAAAVTDACLPETGVSGAYASWRRAIQQRLTSQQSIPEVVRATNG